MRGGADPVSAAFRAQEASDLVEDREARPAQHHAPLLLLADDSCGDKAAEVEGEGGWGKADPRADLADGEPLRPGADEAAQDREPRRVAELGKNGSGFVDLHAAILAEPTEPYNQFYRAFLERCFLDKPAKPLGHPSAAAPARGIALPRRRTGRPADRDVHHSIAFGADHAGLALKDALAAAARGMGHAVHDLGTHGPESVDYPDFAAKVVAEVASGRARFGVLVCGTGIGMSIAANRHPAIRCALVHDATGARLTRAHNDANVMAIGARMTGLEPALDALAAFLDTPFEGGRHARRVAKLSQEPETAR